MFGERKLGRSHDQAAPVDRHEDLDGAALADCLRHRGSYLAEKRIRRDNADRTGYYIRLPGGYNDRVFAGSAEIGACFQHRAQMRRLNEFYPDAPFSLALFLASLIACLGVLGFISGIIHS